jgi:AcrR family transcriptional regulator
MFHLWLNHPLDFSRHITYRSVSYMTGVTSHSAARRHLLRAALKHFANAGYAATSVQQIVDTARVSKPALYYHFQDKAALFEALVHEAHDERYQVLQGAVVEGEPLATQLEKILMALFDCFHEHRELMRIAFSTMFAAPGELPDNLKYIDRCERNFGFVHDLFKRAQKNGELDASFDSEEMAYSFYGMANFYLKGHLVVPDWHLDRAMAQRIVKLFLAGAGPKAGGKRLIKKTKATKRS